MLKDVIIRELSAHLSSEAIVGIRHLENLTSVEDSTQKYIIKTTSRELILIVSSDVSPLIVKRGTDRQRLAKQRLNGLATEVIETPIAEGSIGQKSYAAWIKRTPLSTVPILSTLERIYLVPRVFHWLGEIARQTTTPSTSSKLASNARKLVEFPEMPGHVKGAAEKACEVFLSGQARPIHVLQHGDLWIGNILRSRSAAGFIVIDWPGARLDGVPFFDLVKFALSIGASKSKLRREVVKHSELIHCHPRYASAYVMSGLGTLSAELEYFPKHLFIRLCDQKLNALQGIAAS